MQTIKVSAFNHGEAFSPKPNLIGKLVSVQVFARSGMDSEELVTSSMVKQVGTLEAYETSTLMFKYRLVGGPTEIMYHSRSYCEIYPHN